MLLRSDHTLPHVFSFIFPRFSKVHHLFGLFQILFKDNENTGMNKFSDLFLQFSEIECSMTRAPLFHLDFHLQAEYMPFLARSWIFMEHVVN